MLDDGRQEGLGLLLYAGKFFGNQDFVFKPLSMMIVKLWNGREAFGLFNVG